MINYASPLFVSIVLYVLYALLAAAVVFTLWSVVRSLRLQRGEEASEHGLPSRRLALYVGLLTVAILAATWLLGSSQPITANGHTYDDAFWLRTSDMLIVTPIVLMAVFAVIALAATIIHHRHV